MGSLGTAKLLHSSIVMDNWLPSKRRRIEMRRDELSSLHNAISSKASSLPGGPTGITAQCAFNLISQFIHAYDVAVGVSSKTPVQYKGISSHIHKAANETEEILFHLIQAFECIQDTLLGKWESSAMVSSPAVPAPARKMPLLTARRLGVATSSDRLFDPRPEEIKKEVEEEEEEGVVKKEVPDDEDYPGYNPETLASQLRWNDAYVPSTSAEADGEFEITRRNRLSEKARLARIREMKTHGFTNPAILTCQYCGEMSESYNHAEDHRKIKHFYAHAGIYGCTNCTNKFSFSLASMMEHFRKEKCAGQVTVRKPSECPVNTKRPSTSVPAPIDETRPCPHCGLICETTDEIVAHLNHQHADRGQVQFECSVCQKKSADRTWMEDHKSPCRLGRIILFRGEEKLWSIVSRAQSTPVPPPCPYCGRNLMSTAELDAHMKRIHQPLQPLFVCVGCRSQHTLLSESENHRRFTCPGSGLTMREAVPVTSTTQAIRANKKPFNFAHGALGQRVTIAKSPSATATIVRIPRVNLPKATAVATRKSARNTGRVKEEEDEGIKQEPQDFPVQC